MAEAAVAAPDLATGERRLTAWLVTRPGAVPATADALRTFLRERLPEAMIPAAFAWVRALPRTFSGKIDRRALPAPGPERPDLAARYAPPETPVEEALARIWARVLRLHGVGVHDDFFALGGDSILSLQVVAAAAREGLALTPGDLFRHPTVAQLARRAAVPGSPAAAPARSPAGEPRQGPVPLTPIQRWFLERDLPEPWHFNQALLLASREPLDARQRALAAQACAAALARHPALRLRFERDAGASAGWRQRLLPPGAPGTAVPCPVIDLSALDAETARWAVTGAADALGARFDLTAGPLARAALLDLGPDRPCRLFVAVHHLAVDAVSWRVLVDDLEEACRRLQAGEPLALPSEGTSFARWAEALAELAGTPEVLAELPYWRAVPGPEASGGLAVDGPGGANTQASAAVARVALTAAETRRLLAAPGAVGARINDLLLSALALAVFRWTGQRSLLLQLEGHGREEEAVPGADLSRTVGWFTTAFPVRLDLVSSPGNSSPISPALPAPGGGLAALHAVAERLRAVPRRGLGYGLLRYLCPDPAVRAALAALPQPRLSFNYLGQRDSAFAAAARFVPAPEPTGRLQGRRGERAHLLEIDAEVRGGRLEVRWVFSRNLHGPAIVAALAEGYLAELRRLVDLCLGEAEAAHAVDLRAARSEAGPDGSAVDDAYPLSPAQEGMLYHVLTAPGAPFYQTVSVWALCGPLVPAALRRAWTRLVARHAALRTAFSWEGRERPLQVVRGDLAPAWREVDLSALPAGTREGALAGLLAADRALGFDLARGPLARLLLARMAQGEHRLVWSTHHLIVDGWSLHLLFDEMARLYAGDAEGPLPRPFRDYIAWLEEVDLARAETFWRAELDGFTAPGLPFPERPGAGSPERREERLRLPAAATAALGTLLRRERLTAAAAVAAAWGLLLARYGGAEPLDDLAFGVALAGRPAALAGAESMVGLLLNTLPLRLRVEGAWPARALLAAVRDRLLAVIEHESSPLPEVHAWSRVDRRRPLFESLLVFENYPAARGELGPGLARTELEVRQVNHYPVALTAAPGRELTLALLYDPARFERPLAARLLGGLATLLAALPEAVEGPSAALPLLSEAERHQLLREWNDTAASWPEDVCLDRWLAARMAATPEAVAVVCGEAALTAGELERRAGRLAGRLSALGVGPEVLVGVLLERGPELLVALLAVLRAGGAYVPLDPAHPPGRLAAVLAGAAPRVLIADRPGGAPAAAGAEVVHPREAGPAGRAAAPPDGDPGRLAYVLHTSGSTGRPKGVAVTQRAVVNLLRAMAARPGLGPGDVLVAATTVAFDIAGLELFLPLVTGARLVLASRQEAANPERLLALLVAAGATAFQTTPALWRALLDAGLAPAGRLLALCGGEAMPAGLAAELRQKGASPWNLYGPTEATIWASRRPCASTETGAAAVPLGRPLENTRLDVIGPEGDPLPPLVAGELAIGGSGLARGYLDRPAPTAERFVPDGSGGGPAGARLYRTGDRVRRLPDGDLEFLGRIDRQVKVRGVRVEPGEVEACLAEHPALAAAAVVARPGPGGEVRLIAYTVLRRPASPGELRGFLQERLLPAMVPVAFVPLAALPLAPTGKVDRAALPEPEDLRCDELLFEPPTTAAERAIAAVWREALGVPEVGVRDSFFELGGHSLLLFRVHGLLRERLGREVALADLFEHPTVAALARHLGDGPPGPER